MAADNRTSVKPGPVDPRLTEVIAEELRANGAVAPDVPPGQLPGRIARAVWAWLAEGDE